jgi:urate oxidase
MASVLSSARYGKDNVRVYKVHRDAETGVQTVTEMTVCVLLEGDIEASYVDSLLYKCLIFKLKIRLLDTQKRTIV